MKGFSGFGIGFVVEPVVEANFDLCFCFHGGKQAQGQHKQGDHFDFHTIVIFKEKLIFKVLFLLANWLIIMLVKMVFIMSPLRG